jgi:hypothetical protein
MLGPRKYVGVERVIAYGVLCSHDGGRLVTYRFSYGAPGMACGLNNGIFPD